MAMTTHPRLPMAIASTIAVSRRPCWPAPLTRLIQGLRRRMTAHTSAMRNTRYATSSILSTCPRIGLHYRHGHREGGITSLADAPGSPGTPVATSAVQLKAACDPPTLLTMRDRWTPVLQVRGGRLRQGKGPDHRPGPL